AIVAKALEKDAKYRFQTALEFRDALEGFLTSSGKPMRQEEVGHQISQMFSTTREEVQKQIQVHMEKVANAATVEAPAFGAPSKALQGGTGAALPQILGASGSGSGIVPNFGQGTGASIPPRDVTGAHAAPQAEQKKSPVVLVVIAGFLGLLLVGVIMLVVIGLRHPQPGAPESQQVANQSNSSLASPNSGSTAPLAINQGGTVPPTTGSDSVFPQQGAAETGTAPSATDTPNAPTTDTTKHSGGSHTGHGQSHPQPTQQPTAAPPPTEEGGFLTLDTYPWTKVSEGSKVLGSTPLVHVALSAGSHTLTLENPDQGIKQQTTIAIKSGETVTKRLGLK
ncbi:MAG: hypothetical protein ACRELY_12390, partial [Polyangiaceae bacterium]